VTIHHTFDWQTLSLCLRAQPDASLPTPAAAIREAADILKQRRLLVAIAPSLTAVRFWGYGRGGVGFTGEVVAVTQDGYLTLEARVSMFSGVFAWSGILGVLGLLSRGWLEAQALYTRYWQVAGILVVVLAGAKYWRLRSVFAAVVAPRRQGVLPT
jgi:hypothetical protein